MDEFGCVWPVACWTTEKAVSFMSLLERLGMTRLCAFEPGLQPGF
jgi:hypothetical protein